MLASMSKLFSLRGAGTAMREAYSYMVTESLGPRNNAGG